jgi:hypothetical protein
MKKVILLAPFFTGCLLNFSPFSEGEFLTAYETSICDLYVDCLDGNADGQYDTDNIQTHREVCATHVNTPNQEGCAVVPDRAPTCYEEVLTLVDTISNDGNCALLWTENVLPTCEGTYLNCPTDNRFGTAPGTQGGDSYLPQVTHIDSMHGPTTGGNSVTFTGSGFDASSQVQIGGNWATVAAVNNAGTELVIVIPPSETGGNNINVTNEYGNTILGDEMSYTYWEDMSGKTSITGYALHYRYVGGYADREGQQSVSASIQFIESPEPDNIYFFNYWAIPSMGECIQYTLDNVPYVINLKNMVVDYSKVRFKSSLGNAIELTTDNGGFSFRAEIEDMGLDTTRPYRLETEAENGWPALTSDNIFVGPKTISVATPNIATGSLIQPVWEGDFRGFGVNWTKSTKPSEHYITVVLTAHDDNTAIACAFGDGLEQAAIPTSLFEGGPWDEIAEVEICRVNEPQASSNTTLSAINNGQAQVAGVNCIIGQARLAGW